MLVYTKQLIEKIKCKNYLHNTKRFVLKAKKLFTMNRMILVVVG